MTLVKLCGNYITNYAYLTKTSPINEGKSGDLFY